MSNNDDPVIPVLLLFQIGRLYGKLHKQCGKIFKEKAFPLELDQLPVLMRLYYKGAASQQEIYSELQRDKASVNRTISFLLKKNIVKVIPDSTDKRKTIVALTATGKKLAMQANTILEEFDVSLSPAFTKDERKQFHRLILQLIDNVSFT